MASTDAAVVISDDASAAVRVLSELTQARTLLQQLAGVDSLLPVRAFAVRNEASLRELVPQFWESRGLRPLAASYTGPYDAFIAIRTDVPTAQRFALLLHEYVHLLTTAHVPDPPAWLDEGLSEFWSSLEIDGQQAVVGRPPARHLKLLRAREWLPVDEMRRYQRGKLPDDQGRAAMFYAQSWALVHYLLLGNNPTGPPPFAPAEQSLTLQLEASVRAYVAQGVFSEVAIPSDAILSAPKSQPISEARALAERATMLVFGERPAAALPLVRRSLSLNPSEPLALEVMGTHSFLHNQPEQARAWLTSALEAGPASYTAALYLALLSSSTVDRERYLQLAVRVRPDLGLAWQRLWTVYVEDGRADQARLWRNRLMELLRPFLWPETRVPCAGCSQ